MQGVRGVFKLVFFLVLISGIIFPAIYAGTTPDITTIVTPQPTVNGSAMVVETTQQVEIIATTSVPSVVANNSTENISASATQDDNIIAPGLSSGKVNVSSIVFASGTQDAPFSSNPPSLENGYYVHGPSGVITPSRTIKPGTHPVAVSRVPGNYQTGYVDLVYFHPDGTLWMSQRSPSNPVSGWQPESAVSSFTDSLYSPSIYTEHEPPTDIEALATRSDHNTNMRKWYPSSGWGLWYTQIDGNDVNSTVAVLVRAGLFTDLVYYDNGGNLIDKRFNETSFTWDNRAVIDNWKQPGNQEGVSLVMASPDQFSSMLVIARNQTENRIWTRKYTYPTGWDVWKSTGIPAYSHVGASTRFYATLAAEKPSIIDIVYDKTGSGDYYWQMSDDNGNTWKNEQYVTSGGSPMSVVSASYNRVEFYQEYNGLVRVTTLQGPTYSKIGLAKDGVWYLDANGDFTFNQWNPTVDYKDKAYWFSGGGTGWTPVIGDWSGSGTTKIGLYKDGAWYLDTAGTGNPATVTFHWFSGGSGSVPVVGDWNGDGKTEIGVYNNGAWYLDTVGTGNPATATFHYFTGGSGSVPVVGDWNGDGKTEIGMYNNGAWYLDTVGTGNPVTATFHYFSGGPGFSPIVGDWNSGGTTKIGLYKDGAWYLDYDGDGSFTSNDKAAWFSGGGTGWTPVTGEWNLMRPL